jgi:hypothetical protein
MIRSAFVLVFLAFAGAATASSVVFVDNRAAAGGNGTRERPFATINQGVQSGTIVYVAESDTPYIESVTLKKGQMLIGSAFGLDAVRTELHAEIGDVSVPAMQGPGPAIHGTIATSGDNVIAGCTIFADGLAGIVGSGVLGTLTVRNVYFKSSKAGFAIYLQEQQGNVNISGGSIEAANMGGGIGLAGGYGNVVIDRVPISGEFTSAVRIQARKSGTVTFRRGSKVRVRDAIDDAIFIDSIGRPSAVIFEDTVEVRGRRRGLVVNKVAKVVIGGASTLSTINAAALDVHDSGVELSFESVSAEGVAPGTLDEGIVLDRVRGRVTITGADGKRGTGGAIRHARGNGMRIVHASNVRIAGITFTDSGVNKPARGVRCAGNFEVNSTAICRAALYLRHISDSTFQNIVVDGGSAMGINANNVRDVTFTNLDVHRAGDETFESGALLQEVGGTVTFSASTFTDNAGSEMLIEQRFNNGRIVLDRCTLSAPQRPDVARQLLEIQTFGSARLDVAVRNSDLRDSIGSAIEAMSAEDSFLALSVADTTLQHFGHGIIAATARQASHLAVTLHGSQFAAPAVRERAWIEVSGSDTAAVCADITANRFTAPEGTAIRLAAPARAELRVAGVSGSGARTSEVAMAAANGGAIVTIEGEAAVVPSPCR